MADKLDLSLDDIIKQNKSFKRGGGRGRGRAGGRSTRGGSGRGRGGSATRGSFRSASAGGGIRGGRIQKRRGSLGGFTKTTQVPDVWQHDRFEGGSPVGGARRMGGGGGRESGKILISNLDFGVNDADIQELFGEFGPMRKAAVHYDRSGRSLGIAEVIFEMRADAVKAMKQYSNIPLDGRPMKIQLAGDTAAPVSALQRTGPAKVFGATKSPRGGRGFGGGRGRGRGGSRRGGRGGKVVPPSKEDLDAQLDAYNSKMETD